MMRLKVSAPMTRTRRACPDTIMPLALASAKTNPAQTAWMSKAKPCVMPRPACTMVAVAGNVRSGVDVARTMASMSSGSSPASSSAARPARIARSEVYCPSAAKCRRSMPERERIHSSEVSRKVVNHSFGTIRSGR